MSKGLEVIKDLKDYWNNKKPLSVNGGLKRLYTIEKELKALEILKAFDFEIEDYTEDLNGSVCVKQRRIILDDDEIDLLKEVLL